LWNYNILDHIHTIFLAAFIGGPAVPGDVDATLYLTAGSIIVMPDYFPQSGVLSYFYAFIVDKGVSVNLQIWRPVTNNTAGTSFVLVYQKAVSTSTDNTALTVCENFSRRNEFHSQW
jgi:hypothetical protein